MKTITQQLDEQLGRTGKVLLITTNAITSQNFYAVQFLKESVISSIELGNLDGNGEAVTVLNTTIPAGTVLFANVTAITLTSGLAIAYTN